MTYVIKRRAVTTRISRAAMPGDYGEHRETIVVYPDEENSVETGLVDLQGNPIHRQIKQPVGFIRFKG